MHAQRHPPANFIQNRKEPLTEKNPFLELLKFTCLLTKWTKMGVLFGDPFRQKSSAAIWLTQPAESGRQPENRRSVEI